MAITQSHSSTPTPTGETPALQHVYAWFSALATYDTDQLNALHATGGIPIDTLHPLRHTTALMEATRLGRTELVHWLLEQGAAPALLCGIPKGSAPHCAIRRKHWNIVMALLSKLEYASVVDGYGATLLHALCVEPQNKEYMAQALKVAEQLVKKNCSIDALDHEGITALHHCVINDEPELAALLLHHGANPNALIPDSWVSPLMIAALEKNKEMASLLIRFGADPQLRTREGMTPATTYPALLSIA